MAGDRLPRTDALVNQQPREDSAMSTSTKCTCGSAIIPILNFLAFFLNFVFADVGKVSDKFDTALTPPHYTFLIWIVIYMAEFLFAIYQLFYPTPRNSRLIQTLISLPFIFHQILTAVWLVMFSREKIYEATGVMTGLWILALVIFSLVTKEFRSGRYKCYSAADYFLIELPFGLLLGWETVALLISWSVFIIQLGKEGFMNHAHLESAQIAAFIVSVALLAIAAVLFAGLPTLMDPIVHLPLLWALCTLGHRWYLRDPIEAVHLSSWVTPQVQLGLALTAWIVAGIIFVFHLVAAVILVSSRLCIPDLDHLDTSTISTSTSRTSSSAGLAHRSPRTARSALSAEQVV
eukprot:Protomagalhaensia_wolfi_Nauph_80__828@NODE_147_length_3434_cov_523_177320_g109_i0_p1_GENE_NODE_147_length_3434_cov_523_177320_g109_i0NODE_147_length_3434_cov_523_177320_g109_i0_p1_ORF_typecomplete_len348_score42_70TspO_MBR/PF03073_15/2e05TspO_MBR/PF03073_15/1_8e04CcmF_C/PF16327_5/0_017CcmF_C/PF16327_5/70IncD/PF17628_2/6_7IncD/PF17628_2/19NDUF_B4/PF07225_12/0_98NDUF_B4/PF07225_12/6_9e03_NODE_147_length_3434_cov_523_177320_g109_i017942837